MLSASNPSSRLILPVQESSQAANRWKKTQWRRHDERDWSIDAIIALSFADFSANMRAKPPPSQAMLQFSPWGLYLFLVSVLQISRTVKLHRVCRGMSNLDCPTIGSESYARRVNSGFATANKGREEKQIFAHMIWCHCGEQDRWRAHHLCRWVSHCLQDGPTFGCGSWCRKWLLTCRIVDFFPMTATKH